MSKARHIVHELGHAIRGCEGKFKSTLPGDFAGTGKAHVTHGGKPISSYDKPNNEDAVETDHAFNYGNREEYDNIWEWENPVMEELGEKPRFAHR